MRRLLLLLIALASLLLNAGPAVAQTSPGIDQAANGLRADRVYLDPAAAVPLVEADVRDAVAGSRVRVYVAAVPAALAAGAGGDAALVQAIGDRLADPNAVVLLLTDRPSFYAANGPDAPRGVDAGAAVDHLSRGSFDGPGVTTFVRQFVAAVNAQAASSGSGSGSHGTALVLIVLVFLVALGGGAAALVRARRGTRRKRVALEDARADVESLYGRLGRDVELLSPGGDRVAGQALADAAERYNATGALLAQAETAAQYAAARRTAVEGLAAARVARGRLGLDPGPEVTPSVAGSSS